MPTEVPTWKRVFFRSAGFGAGFAVVLCLIGGALFWYLNRPKPPKPWNKAAITSEYDYVRPQGDQNDLEFNYVLQNNTDFDYRVDSDAGIEITSKLKHERELSTFAFHAVTTEYPIFVPAKNRVWISLKIPYTYPIKEKDETTPEEREQFRTEVAKYVTDKLNNIDGFVMFDTVNRYEIDFPSGWEQRAKQAPTSK